MVVENVLAVTTSVTGDPNLADIVGGVVTCKNMNGEVVDGRENVVSETPGVAVVVVVEACMAAVVFFAAVDSGIATGAAVTSGPDCSAVLFS